MRVAKCYKSWGGKPKPKLPSNGQFRMIRSFLIRIISLGAFISSKDASLNRNARWRFFRDSSKLPDRRVAPWFRDKAGELRLRSEDYL